MVTTEPAEVTASETRPPGFHIRWGWFLGCIASGLVAIAVGWSVAGPAGRGRPLNSLNHTVGEGRGDHCLQLDEVRFERVA